MKSKHIRRTLGYILLVLFILQLSVITHAHSSSQEGILARTYSAKYDKYYIGGEDVGWAVDETKHTDGNVITYAFLDTDSNLTSLLRSYVTNGASMWGGTATIINRPYGLATGLIKTFNQPDSSAIARFGNTTTNASGHLASWEIQMNLAYSQSTGILAHEFGHAIGLADLYATKNSGNLMYGYANSINSPSSADKWGAKVITGGHSAHTWGYKYYSTNSYGNVHIRYCTDCNGLSVVTEQCQYNSNNVCIKCGLPYNYQPYSLEDEES